MKKYVIALDQGTTSSRAMLIDRAGRPVASVQRPFPQIYPQPGWVEHDPQDILSSQLGALTELIMSSNVDTAEIDSIGITNQRETTIVWDYFAYTTVRISMRIIQCLNATSTRTIILGCCNRCV